MLIAVAIVGKFFGAAIAARLTGFDWRASAVIGTLMNTRGLTELIVLNLALEKGVISDALFAVLVLMALVTTFMAGPLLNLLDPKNSYGAPVEEELEEARALSRAEFPDARRAGALDPRRAAGRGRSSRSCWRSPSRSAKLGAAARAHPRAAGATAARCARPAAALQTENRLLRDALERGHVARLELIEQGHRRPRRRVHLGRPGQGPGSRWSRARRSTCCCVDGRRPLLGEGVPRGDVAHRAA